MSGQQRYLGIDFSGDHLKWRARTTQSNVWIAEVEGSSPLNLSKLQRVQELEGEEPPFSRLVDLLKAGQFQAAGIDAPFSLPDPFVPQGNYKALLQMVDQIPLNNRPFPKGGELVSMVPEEALLQDPRPFRATERYWREQGINVRSTLWSKARSGAPMTAACIKLIAQASSPIWPWDTEANGLLVEAFPAAQLREWGWPFERYNAQYPEEKRNRERILENLANRIHIGSKLKETLIKSADALDAVICAFAGMAVKEKQIAHPLDSSFAETEGWIAVYK